MSTKKKTIIAKINIDFDEAEKREQIESGEDITTLFSKIKKWFSSLKAVAFSGSYNDLKDKPDINNAKLTIQRNGSDVSTFTANQSDDVTVDIQVPTKITDITVGATDGITLDDTTFKLSNVNRTNNTSSDTLEHTDDFTVIDSVTTNKHGQVTGVNTKTVTLPEGYEAGTGLVLGSDQKTFSLKSVTRTDTTSNESTGHKKTFTAVDSVTTNIYGQLTAINLKTITLPGVKGDAETSYRTGDINLTPENLGLNKVGNFKAVSTEANQNLTDTEKENARDNIGVQVVEESSTNGNIKIDSEEKTVYKHPTTSGNKHIPSGGSSGQILRWSSDGTAAWGADNNTTYSDFVKSGSGAKAGLVPAPSTTAGTTKYLREDGTWTVPPNTTYTAATVAPLVADTAAVGTSTKYAREDHVHPAQTSVTGNAGSATKLATARSINGISFDGTKDINLPSGRRWWVGSNTTNSNGWYHFLSQDMPTNNDFNMILSITSTYGSAPKAGILYIHSRRNTGSTASVPDKLGWLTRTGWAATSVIAVINGTKIDFYINNTIAQYGWICFTVIQQSHLNSDATSYTPVSSTAPTTGLTAGATSADLGGVLAASRLLTSVSVGSSAQPVYFSEGAPVVCTANGLNLSVHSAKGTSGSTGYVKIATLKITGTYADSPIVIAYNRRQATVQTILTVSFSSINGTNPDLNRFYSRGTTGATAYIYKSAASTWDIYVQKIGGSDVIDVAWYSMPTYMKSRVTITWTDVQQSSAISGWTQATVQNTASRLSNTTAIGSTTQPVYFNSSGVPAACTYKLEKSVPSDAKFTDSNVKVVKRADEILTAYPTFASGETDGSSLSYFENFKIEMPYENESRIGLVTLALGNDTVVGYKGACRGELKLYAPHGGSGTLRPAITDTGVDLTYDLPLHSGVLMCADLIFSGEGTENYVTLLQPVSDYDYLMIEVSCNGHETLWQSTYQAYNRHIISTYPNPSSGGNDYCGFYQILVYTYSTNLRVTRTKVGVTHSSVATTYISESDITRVYPRKVYGIKVKYNDAL